MKKIERILRDIPQHWVGNGFPVQSLFDYGCGNEFEPFLLLDCTRPHQFSHDQANRGVGEHPHKGFETVTILYQGELEANPLVNPSPERFMTRWKAKVSPGMNYLLERVDQKLAEFPV